MAIDRRNPVDRYEFARMLTLTTAATATAGGGQAALATVLGYIVTQVYNAAGVPTTVKIPYFSV